MALLFHGPRRDPLSHLKNIPMSVQSTTSRHEVVHIDVVVVVVVVIVIIAFVVIKNLKQSPKLHCTAKKITAGHVLSSDSKESPSFSQQIDITSLELVFPCCGIGHRR